MVDFGSIYSKLCLKHHIQKQKAVEEALVIDGFLNLSNETLSTETCAILGKIFETSSMISKVDFDYCLLDETAVKSILLGIRSNNSITSLSFKGNAIKNAAVLELATFLKYNRTVTRLSLEWNSLGLNVSYFLKFCGALISNTTLTDLDLKSNQLGSDAATHLGNTIAKNSSLTFIDLNFNNLGNEGAVKLSEGLKENRSLLKISLLGNNISDHILNEIASQLGHNLQTSAEKSKFIGKTEELKQSAKLKEDLAATHIRFLEKDLNEANSSMANIIRETEQRIQFLKDELERKTEELECITTKYSNASMSLQRELEINKELHIKNKELLNELNILKEVHSKFTKQSDEKQRTQSQIYQAEKESMQLIVNKYEMQCQEYEARWKASQAESLNLKEKLITNESELKAVKYESEEFVTKQKAEHKEITRKLEKSHASELKKLRSGYEEREKEYKKKITLLDSQNDELEKDLRHMKHQLLLEKEEHQSYINSIKQQLKSEQKSIIRGKEDKIREVERNREELDAKLQLQISTCSDLSSANSRLESKILNLTSDIASLSAKLEDKRNCVRVAEQRVRNEIKSQLDELNDLKEERIATLDKLRQLQSKHDSEKKSIADTLRELENEVISLKSKLNEKEESILKIKEEESRRVGMLQSAFLQYIHPSAN